MNKFFNIGDKLTGYCNGYFGRDDYYDKICVMVKFQICCFSIFKWRVGRQRNSSKQSRTTIKKRRKEMETIKHIAGELSEQGIQNCIVCGEELFNLTKISWFGEQPKGYQPGEIYYTKDGNRTDISSLAPEGVLTIDCNKPKSTIIKYGMVVFYEPNYASRTITEIGRTQIIPHHDALYIYCETPNPASQIVKGNTIEEVEQKLKELEENTKNRQWLEELFNCI